MRFFSKTAIVGAIAVLALLALVSCAAPPGLPPGEYALIRAAGTPRNPHGGGWGSPLRP
jgi:hypothetical protein